MSAIAAVVATFSMFLALGVGAWWWLQQAERGYVSEMCALSANGVARVPNSRTSFELAGSAPRVVVLPTTSRQPGYGAYRDHWVLLLEPLSLVDASLVGYSATQRVLYASEAKPLQTGDAEFNARFRSGHPESASRLFTATATRRALMQLDARFGVDEVLVENKQSRLHVKLRRAGMNAADALVALRLGAKLRDAFSASSRAEHERC